MSGKAITLNKSGTGRYLEIASGVYCLEAGKGFSRSNVYFVRSGASWVLIDAASQKCGRLIQKTAERLFGTNTRPASILLTHDHPDHAGSALELAYFWKCPVYVHPVELPLATIGDLATVEKYANPLDRHIVLPLLHLMPHQKVEAILAKSSLKGAVQGFDPSAAIPGFPDWLCIPCPGHTPGHIAFFRPGDRLLITGDAVVTVDLNSLPGLIFWALRIKKQRISAPPWYSTWDKQMAKDSIRILAGLKPHILASGHGLPVVGKSVEADLRSLADRFTGSHPK